MKKFQHRFIDISITEPTPLSIGEIKIVHQQCMSELATLKIKNALWCNLAVHGNIDHEDVELVDFKFSNGAYTGRFKVRKKLEQVNVRLDESKPL